MSLLVPELRHRRELGHENWCCTGITFHQTEAIDIGTNVSGADQVDPETQEWAGAVSTKIYRARLPYQHFGRGIMKKLAFVFSVLVGAAIGVATAQNVQVVPSDNKLAPENQARLEPEEPHVRALEKWVSRLDRRLKSVEARLKAIDGNNVPKGQP